MYKFIMLLFLELMALPLLAQSGLAPAPAAGGRLCIGFVTA